jgi:hypothetical protein
VAAHSKNKNREDEQTSFSFWLSSLKAYGRREIGSRGGCGEADLEGPQGREKRESKARGKEKAAVEATDLSPLSR